MVAGFEQLRAKTDKEEGHVQAGMQSDVVGDWRGDCGHVAVRVSKREGTKADRCSSTTDGLVVVEQLFKYGGFAGDCDPGKGHDLDRDAQVRIQVREY